MPVAWQHNSDNYCVSHIRNACLFNIHGLLHVKQSELTSMLVLMALGAPLKQTEISGDVCANHGVPSCSGIGDVRLGLNIRSEFGFIVSNVLCTEPLGSQLWEAKL